MANNKKKQKKQETISQSVAALTANGLKAFRQNDFPKAILAWEKGPANLRPAALLAEAHFRYGLGLFYGPDSPTGLKHLQTAASYQPSDPGYTYHVGLALHRLGDLPGALAAYKTASQAPGPFAARAAYPLALILVQQGLDPAEAPSWKALTAAEQAALQTVSAFRRRPYALPPEAPLLWRALAALDNQETAQAQAGLEKVLAGAFSPAEKRLANYYQGVIAARAEDWDAARRAWDAASAGGLHSARLDSNLAELYQRRAEDLLQEGDLKTALAAAEEARRHLPADKSLGELLAQIHQQLGYQAAGADRWDEAQSHWQAAVSLDSGSFRLAYNLALAFEKSENYIQAGQAWREALRRRPRRADHPDALADDQIARLWQRAAECYTKADEFEEVERTYQQAIKWAPENLKLRLALAKTLISDGRLQAGRNELERLLERDPNHIPALLLLGEAYFRDEDAAWYIKMQARKIWEKVLQVEPENSQAHQLLAEWFIDQAEISYSWDRYAEAVEDYLTALEHRPKYIKILVNLAFCYIQLKDGPRAEEYASQALAQAASLEDFSVIISFWLSLDRGERAWEITAQAETRFEKVPADFYVGIAYVLAKHDQHEGASLWLERAIEKALPEENILIVIGEMLMDVGSPLAVNYLNRAVQVGQMPGQAHMMLGILEAQHKNKAASKKHFAEAERIARKTNDEELEARLQFARMLASAPPEILDSLMKMEDLDLLDDFMDAFGKEFQ